MSGNKAVAENMLWGGRFTRKYTNSPSMPLNGTAANVLVRLQRASTP